LNIILTQLSTSASNYNLFCGGFVSVLSYSSGAAIENLKHFFLDCPTNLQARTTLIGGHYKIKIAKIENCQIPCSTIET
jgi:hypothetical protein